MKWKHRTWVKNDGSGDMFISRYEYSPHDENDVVENKSPMKAYVVKRIHLTTPYRIYITAYLQFTPTVVDDTIEQEMDVHGGVTYLYPSHLYYDIPEVKGCIVVGWDYGHNFTHGIDSDILFAPDKTLPEVFQDVYDAITKVYRKGWVE